MKGEFTVECDGGIDEYVSQVKRLDKRICDTENKIRNIQKGCTVGPPLKSPVLLTVLSIGLFMIGVVGVAVGLHVLMSCADSIADKWQIVIPVCVAIICGTVSLYSALCLVREMTFRR